MAESAFRMNVRIIVCGMRQYDPQITTKLAEIAWRYRHKGVSVNCECRVLLVSLCSSGMAIYRRWWVLTWLVQSWDSAVKCIRWVNISPPPSLLFILFLLFLPF